MRFITLFAILYCQINLSSLPDNSPSRIPQLGSENPCEPIRHAAGALIKATPDIIAENACEIYCCCMCLPCIACCEPCCSSEKK